MVYTRNSMLIGSKPNGQIIYRHATGFFQLDSSVYVMEDFGCIHFKEKSKQAI